MAWIEQRGTRFRVRCRTESGTVATDSSHPTFNAADIRRMQVDLDQATGTYLDPALGRITLAAWADLWQETYDAGPARRAASASHLRNHILPRLGRVPLARIDRHMIKMFTKHLKTQLADSSTVSVMSLLSQIMREAVADRRISHNPCQGVKVATGRRPERPWATPDQIDRIIHRIDRYEHRILILTAAYTGMRWGELTGLHRDRLDLAAGIIHIDAETGALHEVGGRLFLGPPKTADSARPVHLPPFLTHLLGDIVRGHSHPTVFTGERGGYLRRSNFSTRVWRPAVNGDPNHPPIIEGMHFHDLRHTHKTWMIEDDIPEIVQAKRLGHRLPGVRGIYSHTTPAMIQRLTADLQRRFITTQTPAGITELRPPQAA
jgi:integrase